MINMNRGLYSNPITSCKNIPVDAAIAPIRIGGTAMIRQPAPPINDRN